MNTRTRNFRTIVLLPICLCMACSTNRLSVELPCMQEAMDDETSYRALGVGESLNLQSARQQSYLNARHDLTARFAASISQDGNMRTSIQAATFSIPALQNVCEKITIDKQKVYRVYTAVKLSQDDISEHKISIVAISGDTVNEYLHNVQLSTTKKYAVEKKNSRKRQKADEVQELELSRDKFREYANDKYGKKQNNQK